MSKHTPGPWKAHFEEAYFVTGPDRGRVAMMMNLKGPHGLGGRRSGEESAANARLIAAAPELLEALKQILAAYCGVMRSEFDFPSRPWTPERDNDIDALQAIAAIRKATGEQQ